MKALYFLIGIFLLLTMGCTSSSSNEQAKEPSSDAISLLPPDWAKDAIWYQIFVERFRNGDPNNNPTMESIRGSWPYSFPADWKVTDWTSDWYDNKRDLAPKDFYDLDIQSRRYGGDLQGVLDQLDYLESLGVNALYLNPINDAQSLHKFDVRNYRHVDVNFGPDPDGDRKIIASEDPLDPTTWQWTSADQLFLKLIKELHRRDMRIILDYSWNHTGTRFWAWEDILANGADSKFADWYEIQSFDDPSTPDSEFKYTGWAGVAGLPELKKVDVENRVHGKPYKGNIHPDVKAHIFHVTKRWLDPNGDGRIEDGIDGYRLDVADQIGMDFWREYRRFVRSVHPEALLVGEIWWEEWPDVLMDPRPYVNDGEVFDIVMFYQGYRPTRAFFAKTSGYGGAEKFVADLQAATADMPRATAYSMMKMSSSHDAPRLLTSFENKGQYKYKSKSSDDSTYITGRPSAETYDRVRLFLLHQFTTPGAPQIWAGDEMGMWGADDPDCRKPLWWPEMTFANESADPYKEVPASYEVGFHQALNDYYKQLIRLRKAHPVFRSGELKFLLAEGDLLAYELSGDGEQVVVVLNNSTEEVRLPAALQLEGEELLGQPYEKEKLAGLSGYIVRK
ncbi:MAG: glycoside hydrolase family 13 protein [Bacteroidota bacterium]